LSRFPPALEPVQWTSTVQLSAFALKPLPNPDFVVRTSEITDNEAAKEVQSFRDLVRRRSRIRAVSANTASRDTKEPAQEFRPKDLRHAIPFEVRHWRLLEREIQVRQSTLQSGR
jgi:hypothetical protein